MFARDTMQMMNLKLKLKLKKKIKTKLINESKFTHKHKMFHLNNFSLENECLLCSLFSSDYSNS